MKYIATIGLFEKSETSLKNVRVFVEIESNRHLGPNSLKYKKVVESLFPQKGVTWRFVSEKRYYV